MEIVRFALMESEEYEPKKSTQSNLDTLLTAADRIEIHDANVVWIITDNASSEAHLFSDERLINIFRKQRQVKFFEEV